MSHSSGSGSTRSAPGNTAAGRTRIGLIGVTGYGRTHLLGSSMLEDQGTAELAAYADVAPDAPDVVAEHYGRAVPGYQAYDDMLAKEDLDVVVISTPIHLHAEMIERAFSYGISVLVEKPPVVTIQDMRHLLATQAEAAAPATEQGGRLEDGKRGGPYCQVGFQSAGSPAVSALGNAIRSGALGEVELISAVACWQRADSYYARAPWSGRLTRQGRPVLDGTLTNPLAHALMNCLQAASDDDAHPATPSTVQAELYRCREQIEGDDTSSVRISTTNGRTIVLVTTLCAAKQSEPYIVAKGTHGTATAFYTSGRFRTEPPGLAPPVEAPIERSALLANLVATVRGEDTVLRCPLKFTENYVLALNGIYESAGRPLPIGPEHLTYINPEADRIVHLRGIEEVIGTCAKQGLLFSETGQGWAQSSAAFELAGYRHFGLFAGEGS